MKTRLRMELYETVQRNKAESILLSGGIDSSSLAAIDSSMTAITTGLPRSDDLKYSKIVARHLEMKHITVEISKNEAVKKLPELIRCMESFDRGLLNDLPLHLGMEKIKDYELNSIMTGDGGDWIFAGYQFLWRHKKDLNIYLQNVVPHLLFSSSKLSNSFGLNLQQPYLDEKFVDFSLQIPYEMKVVTQEESWGDVAVERLSKEEEMKKQGFSNTGGKWILRETMKNLLPAEITHRPKSDLEFGSGFSKLSELIDKEVHDVDFKMKSKEYDIKFIDKTHLYFYELFLDEVGEVKSPVDGERECINCSAGIEIPRRHCRTCGDYSP